MSKQPGTAIGFQGRFSKDGRKRSNGKGKYPGTGVCLSGDAEGQLKRGCVRVTAGFFPVFGVAGKCMVVLAVGDKDPGAEEKACVHPVAGYG
jgi:hypothetical protein